MPKAREPLKGSRYVLLACLLLACRDHSAAPIRIVLGPAPQDEISLVPRASLAEYIEVSPAETHLLLSFSSVERACDAGPDSSKEAVGLSVRIVLPQGEKLSTGSFPLLSPTEEQSTSYATSTVKVRGQRRELLQGGNVDIRALDLGPQGSVQGMLKLEFPGDHRHAATRVSGRFVAYFCRVNRLR